MNKVPRTSVIWDIGTLETKEGMLIYNPNSFQFLLNNILKRNSEARTKRKNDSPGVSWA